ncbi:LysR family transcriptional regulator [Variovorax paradoxus]|jgi:LysR family transcriptional regulator (chromosome initiation inhibitor)|uniref:LysR family transcriptional regulator ArgP n=1 Tax=Variovorax paradoxus TaxID=34073 RepID=UPI0006E5ABF2|nr:LysR family transcriptional regulator [Variovorax paradoxus]KPU93490.1 LysR family transcriptional regulator [Variovorax paradoxus]KPU95233.1 LysR family transcriptional regulator [Variovorax paradoxus]KPV09288.1 LysR family transcriptional regulator [Variovorax paradoxus]KPV21807.1 LysR family transcriptional regulator [Variovorax paradoxus]
MLDYAALNALATVVREGSFERAARALNVTPSAVSQRVKLLEERIGGALLVRGQPCVATEAGLQLCRHVERVGMLEHELRDALPVLSAGEAGERVTVRVAVNADSLATWFVAAAAAFSQQHGALLDLTVDDQDHTAERLRSGAVLAAVTALAQPVAGCNSEALGTMHYVAAASPAFVQSHFATGVGARTLARAPSLVFDRKDALQARWVRRICHREVETPRHWLPSPQAFVEAARAGMGWGMHPLSMVAQALRDGSLVELVPGSRLPVPLYWQQARAAPRLLARLGDCVRAASRTGPHALA